MDWTPNNGLHRYKLWKKKGILLFDTVLSENNEECRSTMLLCDVGDRGLELDNSWNLIIEQQKRLVNYWTNFKTYVISHANQIIVRYKPYCLQQEEQYIVIWITVSRSLATECYYGEIRDKMLKYHIVFATNSEVVRTKCLEVDEN